MSEAETLKVGFIAILFGVAMVASVHGTREAKRSWLNRHQFFSAFLTFVAVWLTRNW